MNFILRSNKIHENRYDYKMVEYVNIHTKVKIICFKYGIFEQKPYFHMINQSGCPKCRLSKGEFEIHKILKNKNLECIPQKTFDNCRNPLTNRKLKFDFYILSKNLLIEYDGPQHYRIGKIGNHFMTNKELDYIQYLDKIKNDFVILNNIKLIRIKYTDFNKIDTILINEL